MNEYLLKTSIIYQKTTGLNNIQIYFSLFLTSPRRRSRPHDCEGSKFLLSCCSAILNTGLPSHGPSRLLRPLP